MLDFFRKHTKTVIWTVVASFVLFGAVSFGTSFDKKTRFAGEVFGKGVSFQEFDRYNKAARIFSYGQKDSPEAQDPDVLRLKAWQNLAYAKQAQKLGIKVSDEEVSAELNRLLTAQGFTNPTPELYKNWLKMSLQTHPQEFEKMIREMIRIQKMVAQSNIQPSDIPTISEKQAKERFLKDQKTLSAEMIVFNSVEEARDFKSKLEKEEDWKNQADEKKLSIVEVDEAPLSVLENSWQIPSEDLLALHQLKEKEVSEPVLIQDYIALIRVMTKSDADMALWNSDKIKEYQEKMSADAKRLHLLKWHVQLMQNANIIDYADLR